MIALIDCLSISLISNSLPISCTCLCHLSNLFCSTQTLGSATIQNRIPRRNFSYVTRESSNHRCRPPQWDSLKLLVLCHQIFLSWNDDFFLFLVQRWISSFCFRQAVYNLPSDHWHTSSAWRHLLQLFNGFSCTPGIATAVWVESSRLRRMLEFLPCIPQTHRSFLFLCIQIVP